MAKAHLGCSLILNPNHLKSTVFILISSLAWHCHCGHPNEMWNCVKTAAAADQLTGQASCHSWTGVQILCEITKHQFQVYCKYSSSIQYKKFKETPKCTGLLPQPNSTQPRVGLALFSYGNHNHKTTNRPPLFLSSYTTKLDQIQYATLFQPN